MTEVPLMTDLLAARAQMAMSLAFHIIFAVVGIVMPLLMVIAEGFWFISSLANRRVYAQYNH